MHRSHATHRLDKPMLRFREGDRVIARSRPGFPPGTVVKSMTRGFALVRWDRNVLEIFHQHELAHADALER